MADVNMEKVYGFLKVHDRWEAPFLSDIEENSTEYYGLVIVDTHTNNGKPASMLTPRALDDISQFDNLQIGEVRMVEENDALLSNCSDKVQPGHMVVMLSSDMGQRIRPQSDLINAQIPKGCFY